MERNPNIPELRPGDTVKVNVRVVEGTRSRIQVFEGVVIARKGGGLRETFTVRKISFGVGVERVGATVQLHFAAGLVATLASSLLLERFGYRRIIVVASAMLAAGATSVALAPSWGLLLVGVTGGGLGFGLLNVGLNLVVARTFAPNAAPFLNLVSALFGVGAVLGPLAVGAVGVTMIVLG